MHVEKPLLGFGWMGWVLLAIASALVAVWVTGYNLQYQLLALVQTIFGNDAMVLFAKRFLVWHSFNALHMSPHASFGLWGMCAVLIAFQIYPHRIVWWRQFFVIALAVVSPPILFTINMRLSLSTKLFRLWNYHFPEVASLGIILVTLLILLGFLTRSKRVLIGTALLSIVSLVIAYFTEGYYLGPPSWYELMRNVFGWAWNPLLLAILLSWAIPARIRYHRICWICEQCRYDMRDLETNTCPECGVINERMPAPAPTSTP